MNVCFISRDFERLKEKVEYCKDKCDEHIMNTWTSPEPDDIDAISDILDEICEIIEKYEDGRR
ncbi:MAG: hypothetical protein IKO41_21355 [Lachnospiraceae bacterium]|nr:hypothetical protein [Lachnospiraceae bacterium]